MSDGYKAKSFRGIPIAIEHHADGSVTICKDILNKILNDRNVPIEIKGLLEPPASGIIYFLNESTMHSEIADPFGLLGKDKP